MTSHYSKEFKVETYTILGRYLSKNGTKNVSIRVRVTSKKAAKRQIKEKRYDIPVLDHQNKNISLSPSQFKANKYSSLIKGRVAEIDERIKFAIHHFLSHRKTFNTKMIREFIYVEMDNQARIISNEFETDPEIVDLFQKHLPDEYKKDKIPLEVINRFDSLPDDAFIDSETGEQIDFGDIINSLEVEYNHKKRFNELNQLPFDERYKKGLFDKTNIFEVFGYCYSNNEKTGKPFISNSYKSLLVRLIDYRYNRNPKETIEHFNIEWIKDFLIFLREEGYSINRFKNINPFLVSKYSNDIILSDRNPYSYQSFDKQVKHLKYYIKILIKEKLLSRAKIDTMDISTDDFVKKDSTFYTRCSHALLQSEIHDIMNARLTGKLETTRIMFLLQTLIGGLRNDEFMNKFFKLKSTDEGLYYFSFYANKVNDFQENPLIEGYTDVVLKQINYKLPAFLKVDEYRASLKTMAKEIGLNREIRYKVQMANGKAEPKDEPIHELISPYWCRKSFVKLGRAIGWTNETIASFTGHSDTRTIDKNYFDKLSLDEKSKLVNK